MLVVLFVMWLCIGEEYHRKNNKWKLEYLSKCLSSSLSNGIERNHCVMDIIPIIICYIYFFKYNIHINILSNLGHSLLSCIYPSSMVIAVDGWRVPQSYIHHTRFPSSPILSLILDSNVRCESVRPHWHPLHIFSPQYQLYIDNQSKYHFLNTRYTTSRELKE